MKFEIKLSYLPTAESKAGGDGDPTRIFEMEGELDAIKTYIKLADSDAFNWGAIVRLDNLVPGDVDRWLIQKSSSTGELFMSAFSFFDVDPEININALEAACYPDQDRNQTLNKALGGGYF